MKTASKLSIGLLAGLALLASTPARADVGCAMTVTSAAIDTTGTLNVSMTNSTGETFWWYICNTSGSVAVNNGYTSTSVASDACKSIHTQFLTARASNRPIVIWFHGPANCTAAALPASGTVPSPFPTNFAF